MDTSIFEELGLTNSEIKVYLALLSLGSSTAGKILEKSNLQNSVLHRALNSLIERGLINFIIEGKRKEYTATDPESFLEFIDEKKKRFEKLLPQLKEQQKQVESNNATVYKGIKGIKEIYNILINSKAKEYNTFGGGKRVTFDIMGELWWRSFHTKRIANKIVSRQIFDDSIKEFGKELNKKSLTHIKFLSQDFEQLTETVICGDQVAIIIFTENSYGLLIKDKAVVEGYKKYFELLWKKART